MPARPAVVLACAMGYPAALARRRGGPARPIQESQRTRRRPELADLHATATPNADPRSRPIGRVSVRLSKVPSRCRWPSGLAVRSTLSRLA